GRENTGHGTPPSVGCVPVEHEACQPDFGVFWLFWCYILRHATRGVALCNTRSPLSHARAGNLDTAVIGLRCPFRRRGTCGTTWSGRSPGSTPPRTCCSRWPAE